MLYIILLVHYEARCALLFSRAGLNSGATSSPTSPSQMSSWSFPPKRRSSCTRPIGWTELFFFLQCLQGFSSAFWQEKTVDSGDFTVESDRQVVMKLGEMAVEHKLQNLLLQGDLSLYRFFLAHRPMMLGQAALTWELEGFLEHFQFKDLTSAVQDESSMSALLCATFAGDVNMVRLLVAQQADLTYRLRGLEHLGFADGLTLLIAALKSRQDGQMIQALLDLGADVHVVTRTCACAAASVKSAEHVALLLAASADFHSPVGVVGLTPLAAASGMSNVGTVKAMLELRCSVNPELKGLGVTPLLSAVTLNRGCKDSAEIVGLLLAARAEPNTVSVQSAFWGNLTWMARLKVSLLGREFCRPKTREFASLPGQTALLKASMCGSEESCELLLRHGAEVLPNDFGETPQSLAVAQGHYNVLHLFETVSV